MRDLLAGARRQGPQPKTQRGLCAWGLLLGVVFNIGLFSGFLSVQKTPVVRLDSLDGHASRSYLQLVENAVTGTLYETASCLGFSDCTETVPYNATARFRGHDWPATGYTTIGHLRLRQFQAAIEEVISNQVPGDIMEIGVWRGGACILAAATLQAFHATTRTVWVADAFGTIPSYGTMESFLSISQLDVENNFAKFGLLHSPSGPQVKFLPGLVSQTLPQFAAENPETQIAVLRIDLNFHDAYVDALYNLYERVPLGGIVIFDNYQSHPGVQQAWKQFVEAHGLSVELELIDEHAIWFRKVAVVNVDQTKKPEPRDNLIMTSGSAPALQPERGQERGGEAPNPGPTRTHREAHEAPANTPQEEKKLAACGGASLADFFWHATKQWPLFKWHHFFEIYHQYLDPVVCAADRNSSHPLTMMEIGLFKGGSVEMWRHYLGPEALFIGVDIDPATKRFEHLPKTQIFLGSQEDPVFLESIAEQVGGFDIIIDDGGPTMKQQITTFQVLFKYLNPGGVFWVEDTHTSYWERYGGGLRKPGSFLQFAQELTDAVNSFHFTSPEQTAAESVCSWIESVHFHDSIVVFQKARLARQKPVASIRGGGAKHQKVKRGDQNPSSMQNSTAPVCNLLGQPAPPCRWHFIEYQPSEYEQGWWEKQREITAKFTQNSKQTASPFCDKLHDADEWAVANAWVLRMYELNSRFNSRRPTGFDWPTPSEEFMNNLDANSPHNHLFSRMVYEERCSGVQTGRQRAQLIEPLSFILRDPTSTFPCTKNSPDDNREKLTPQPPLQYGLPRREQEVGNFSWEVPQSKRMVLLAPFAPWADLPLTKDTSWHFDGFDPVGWTSHALPSVLIDAGAGVYGHWPNSLSSTRWFTTALQDALNFSMVLNFEAKSFAPDEIEKDVPADLLRRLEYVNHPISADPQDQHYFWKWVKEWLSTAGYSVVKLDVDSPTLERKLVETLLTDQHLASLVKEFCFEHHTKIPEMAAVWTEEGMGDPLVETLEDSYKLFTGLRKRGIRAHSWP